ncbi:MAG: hypothetical protein A2W91_03185 [Bacteroidetes bacterium GWF2_38_335]|nr:MAG: hypothetical protein A2W91_03185 [Bacteroidetes bacterium GWF2_38_335]OFY77506.1 MAG: hypothetical protein A2281_01575 [Bacteroidetes bacterium RIFOXYA12_FULL_38_20]HBS87198.1 hypothetical protein [Bacteroidales bacterium]
MQLFQSYLERYSSSGEIISDLPEKNLAYSVVIPCFDEDTIIPTLNSLSECDLPTLPVEVLVVVNSPVNSPKSILDRNKYVLTELSEIIEKSNRPGFRIFPIECSDMPVKTAGVGLARKTGMDESVRRFIKCGNPHGVIICFDADSLCTKNYFTAIENAFREKGCNTGLLHFEHPVNGQDYEPQLYKAIYQYELHLRYYRWALKYTGFPYYHYTIGSSFAVRADAYCKAGGMNKRQAGEDFYFLHKVFPYGKIVEINEASVFPSPRRSHRVPFGTGAAINEMLDTGTDYKTYSLDAFLALKHFFEKVPLFYNQPIEKIDELLSALHPALNEYLKTICFSEKVVEVSANVTGIESFIKRFYSVFDAFRIIKFFNSSHEGFFNKMPVDKESAKLLEKLGIVEGDGDVLEIFRQMDRT